MVAGACGCLWPGWSLESQVWALMAPLPKAGVKLHPSFCLLKEKLPLEHPTCCLLQGVHQLERIGCRDAGVTCPRRGRDGGCAVSQDVVAVHIGNRSLRCLGTACSQSVAGPHKDSSAAGLGLGLSHQAPPCWHTPIPSTMTVTLASMFRYAYGYLDGIASLILPLAENSITPH